MNESLGEHIVLSFQRLLPLLSSVLFLFLTYLPIDSFFLNSLRPATTLICAYFWLLYRPDIFNLGSVYVLGLVEDVVAASPFGTNILALLLLYVLVINLAKYFNAKPFVVIWCGFVAVLFVVSFAKWLLISIYYGQFLPLYVLMFGFFSTIAFYPIVSYANVFIGSVMIKEEA